MRPLFCLRLRFVNGSPCSDIDSSDSSMLGRVGDVERLPSRFLDFLLPGNLALRSCSPC